MSKTYPRIPCGYSVEEYAPDGSAGMPDLYRNHALDTLADARRVVRERLGVKALRPERRWQPDDDAIEGWNAKTASEPGSDGCGGYVIKGPFGSYR